jgi:CubicO group peptidase (beta-lactamase class C family)
MLEEVSGELWEDLMRQELFGPLGMTATGFGAPGAPGVPDQPWGHSRQGPSWLPIAPGPLADNPDAIGPAGTVHTTLADYARYMAAHLAGARGTGGLLPPAAFGQLHSALPGTSYALGWGVTSRPWARGRVLQHAGSNTLWFAVVWIAPERDLAMFVVANAAGDAGAAATDDAAAALVARFEAAYP